jgi:hypothetical protein
MGTRSLRHALLAMILAAILVSATAASAQDGTLPFTIDTARLAADRHTVVVSGIYTCPPLDLNVPGGGGTIDLTVRQGRVTGFGFVPIQVCDGSTQAWEADVTTFGTRQFKRGTASASASGDVNGADLTGQPVHLRVDIASQPVTITRG